MPPFFQLFHDPGRECLFHLDLLSTDPLPSRRVERILRIHQEVHCIHDDLDMALRLHETTHNAERSNCFSVLHQESRNDRVQRFLSRSQAVFHCLIQCKVCPAVLQRDPCSGYYDPGSKSHVIALDVGDHVAFPVRCAEIDRSSAERIARLRCERLFSDERPSSVRIFIRKQRLHRCFHIIQVRNIPVSVRKCQFHRLQLFMHGICIVPLRKGIPL